MGKGRRQKLRDGMGMGSKAVKHIRLIYTEVQACPLDAQIYLLGLSAATLAYIVPTVHIGTCKKWGGGSPVMEKCRTGSPRHTKRSKQKQATLPRRGLIAAC
jgi:hypothetical protein